MTLRHGPLRAAVFALMTAVLLPHSAIGQSEARHVFLAGTQVNGDDLYLTGGYRVAVSPGYGFGVSVDAFVRPYEEWVRKGIRPRVFMQMHETRYAIGMSADEHVHVTDSLALFATGGIGYTAGDLKGTHDAPREGWIPLASAGVAASLPLDGRAGLEIRAGYRYAELRADTNHWMFLTLGLTISDKE